MPNLWTFETVRLPTAATDANPALNVRNAAPALVVLTKKAKQAASVYALTLDCAMENAQMNGRMKGLIAVACVAVIGAAVYLASDRMGLLQNEALFGARDERTSECNDANATMEIVRKGAKVPPQMMSQTNAEYILTTMACKPSR